MLDTCEQKVGLGQDPRIREGRHPDAVVEAYKRDTGTIVVAAEHADPVHLLAIEDPWRLLAAGHVGQNKMSPGDDSFDEILEDLLVGKDFG